MCSSSGGLCDNVVSEPIPDTTPPNGNIITPANNSSIAPGTINIAANASDDSGSGVKNVECLVRYDGEWHSIATSTAAPYGCSWNTPNGLTSQTVLLAIRIVDNANNVTEQAGGNYTIKFISLPGNENAVPKNKRFYLNQRSLLPKGDSMCGVASIAMVLASGGSISGDASAMKAEAEKMWNAEAVRYPSVGMVANALTRRKYTVSTPQANLEANWQTLKQEISAGRPVIVNARGNSMTPSGHYFVAVGYKDDRDMNQRVVYAYDPFGRHKDCYPSSASACSQPQNRWFFNSPEPNSTVGLWASYPWAKLNPAIVTAQRNTLVTAVSQNDDMFEPDIVSDEPSGPEGDSDGGEAQGLNNIFLPLTMR